LDKANIMLFEQGKKNLKFGLSEWEGPRAASPRRKWAVSQQLAISDWLIF
jgi:hypothetical protein